MEGNQFKREKKTMHLAEGFYTKKIVFPLLPIISKTPITPNMVTITNFFFSFLVFLLAYNQHFIIVGILIQLYLFLDILDGNLARYKNMKSKFGATLDAITDHMFYSLIFVFLGIRIIPWYLILAVVLLINFYGVFATYYIVPRLRKLKVIKRKGLKKFFMEKGYIIGMDLGTVDILSTIFLLLGMVKTLYIVLIIGHIIDMFYRWRELKYNQSLPENR